MTTINIIKAAGSIGNDDVDFATAQPLKLLFQNILSPNITFGSWLTFQTATDYTIQSSGNKLRSAGGFLLRFARPSIPAGGSIMVEYRIVFYNSTSGFPAATVYFDNTWKWDDAGVEYSTPYFTYNVIQNSYTNAGDVYEIHFDAKFNRTLGTETMNAYTQSTLFDVVTVEEYEA